MLKMNKKDREERDKKIYEELSSNRPAYRIAEKYGLTEWRVRQIKHEVEMKKKMYTWTDKIIYPNVKKWFKRNKDGMKRVGEAGIRPDKVMGFLCDDTRTLSVKTINTMLDVMDMSFEEAFEVRRK